MKHTLFSKLLRLTEDVCTSLLGSGPPLRKILDREYVAAWNQFQGIKPDGIHVLVDVGAHDGWYAKRAALYFPLRRVVLVEPLPAHAAKLHKCNLPGLRVVESALSDRKGRAGFTLNSTAQASSLLEMAPGMADAYQLDMSAQQQIEVAVSTLDDLCRDEGIDRIDLLKVDVQGAEKLLLAGGREALRNTKYLQIEVLFVEHYRGCALFAELHSLLDELGFELCRLGDFCNDSRGRLLQADAVYKNRGG